MPLISMSTTSIFTPAIGDPDISTIIVKASPLISEGARRIFQWVFITFVLVTVDSFGIITNIINIICFVKQGLKDAVNVSLLALAISDLGCLITLLWTCICSTPAVSESDLPFDSVDIQYLTSGWPHVVFARITSWITALIALERCLCIIIPLKVKTVITPNRVVIIIVCIFIIHCCSISPIYCVNRFGMKFSIDRNKTILGLLFTENRAVVEEYTFIINNLLLPFASFLMIIICTITLVIKLREKAYWRFKATAGLDAEIITDRDQRVAKMVVMISTLFIACFIPFCFMIMAMLLEPEISVDGQYKNTLYVLGTLGFLMESANSSMNIFIYYHMSSRYRCVFRQLLVRKEKGCALSAVRQKKR